jgi:hypothetical protein
MKKLWLVVLTLGFAAAGSATPALAASKARLYNLSTGEVAVAEFHNKWQRGHGDIKVTLGGQNLQGEFSTVANSESSWGSIYGQGVSAGLFSTHIAGAQRGEAIASGSGTVLRCEYMVSGLTMHGHGYCTDNHDGKYQVMF